MTRSDDAGSISPTTRSRLGCWLGLGSKFGFVREKTSKTSVQYHYSKYKGLCQVRHARSTTILVQYYCVPITDRTRPSLGVYAWIQMWTNRGGGARKTREHSPGGRRREKRRSRPHVRSSQSLPSLCLSRCPCSVRPLHRIHVRYRCLSGEK